MTYPFPPRRPFVFPPRVTYPFPSVTFRLPASVTPSFPPFSDWGVVSLDLTPSKPTKPLPGPVGGRKRVGRRGPVGEALPPFPASVTFRLPASVTPPFPTSSDWGAVSLDLTPSKPTKPRPGPVGGRKRVGRRGPVGEALPPLPASVTFRLPASVTPPLPPSSDWGAVSLDLTPSKPTKPLPGPVGGRKRVGRRGPETGRSAGTGRRGPVGGALPPFLSRRSSFLTPHPGNRLGNSPGGGSDFAVGEGACCRG